MREIKILHTSDILAGSTEIDVPSVFDEVNDDLIHRYELRNQIDYLIVSGNITADGSESSFNAAHEILLKLAASLLRRDNGEIRLTRVLLVPGAMDVPVGRGFDGFTRFHDRFFEEEIKVGRVEPFDPEEAVFRSLKDLTLIGLCYWKLAGQPVMLKTLGDLKHTVFKAKKRLLDIEYTDRTPTILVTADNIVFDGVEGSWSSFQGLQAAFKDGFKTTLHLLGANEAMCYLPSPLAFNHIGICTGRRNPGGFWPLKLNLLQIRKEALKSDPPQSDSPFITARIFRRLSEKTVLSSFDWVSGQLDLFFGRALSPDHYYSPFLEKLEEAFKHNNFIAVTGFPGAGKGNFFDFIKSQNKLADQKIHVVPLTIDTYDGFADRLKRAGETIRKDTLGDDIKVVLAIHDRRFAQLPNSEKIELQKTLEKNDPFAILPQIDLVLYLMMTLDYTLGYAPIKGRTDSLPLPALPANAVKSMVSDYSCCAPIEADYLRYLTGGYAGFSNLILRATTGSFANLSGAEPIHKEMASLLMQQALAAPSVIREAKDHRNIFGSVHAGPDVCHYIEEEIQKIKQASDINGLPKLPQICIKVEALKEMLKNDPLKQSSIQNTLERLRHAGILSKDDLKGDAPYKLQVVAPFLIDEETESVVQQRDEEWPTLSKEDFEGPVDFGIIAPLEEEREAILRKLPNNRMVNPNPKDVRVYYFAKLPVTYPDGEKGFYRVVLTSPLDMGETDAAIVTSDLIDKWNPSYILLIGIAGGVEANGVKLGDILVANQVANYSLERVNEEKTEIRWKMQPVDPRLHGFASNFSAMKCLHLITENRPVGGTPQRRIGPIATGDKVINKADVLRLYRENVPKLIGVEMEAWGVASRAFQSANSRKFFMVRGVSDLADGNKDSSAVVNWRPYACDVAASYAIALLQSGPLPPEERKK
jgi:nucleoside phosphorylase